MKNKHLKLRDCIIATPDVRSRDYFVLTTGPKKPLYTPVTGAAVDNLLSQVQTEIDASAEQILRPAGHDARLLRIILPTHPAPGPPSRNSLPQSIP